MKVPQITLTLGLTLTAALISHSVWAANVQKWSGTGTVYSPAGQQLKTYQITVENTDLGGGVTQSEATITAADGSTKTVSQKITSSAKGWSVDSNLGKGGGTCYGADICENYIADDQGNSYATTIVTDSAGGRRDVTFVLKNGQAVEVLRENISRFNYK